jgi:hypothetical protein
MQQLPAQKDQPAVREGAGEDGQAAGVVLKGIEDGDGTTCLTILGGLHQELGEGVSSHAGDACICPRAAENVFSSRAMCSRSIRLTLYFNREPT